MVILQKNIFADPHQGIILYIPCVVFSVCGIFFCHGYFNCFDSLLISICCFICIMFENDQFVKLQADDFSSNPVIDLRIMHHNLIIPKFVMLFYVLNSEQFFICLDGSLHVLNSEQCKLKRWVSAKIFPKEGR